MSSAEPARLCPPECVVAARPFLEGLGGSATSDMIDDFLPFWFSNGIDGDRGGFICGLDHSGAVVDDSKFTWYQGRGIWVLSHMSVHAEVGAAATDPESETEPLQCRLLRAAVATRDFCLRHCRRTATEWYLSVARDGSPVDGEGGGGALDAVGYAGLFVAEGLQELARAATLATAERAGAGDRWLAVLDVLRDYDAAADVADSIAILKHFLARRDADAVDAPEDYFPAYEPGARTLGHHMICLRLATQLLRHPLVSDDGGESAAVAAIADRMVRAITTAFWNPRVRLMTECLGHDYGRPAVGDPREDFAYLGHGIETMWMLMDEARRRHDAPLFWLAAQRFHRSVEVAWDRVYGGLFRGMAAETGVPVTDKVLWVQEEAIIGCLLIVECITCGDVSPDAALPPIVDFATEDVTAAPALGGEKLAQEYAAWAIGWCRRLWAYVTQRWSLRPYGFPGWMVGGARDVKFREHDSFGPQALKCRKENYHHPRAQLLAAASVSRVVAALEDCAPPDD